MYTEIEACGSVCSEPHGVLLEIIGSVNLRKWRASGVQAATAMVHIRTYRCVRAAIVSVGVTRDSSACRI